MTPNDFTFRCNSCSSVLSPCNWPLVDRQKKSPFDFTPTRPGYPYAAPQAYYPVGGLLAFGDIDGDGKLDIVRAHGIVSVWLGSGDGTFAHALNGDGHLDVVTSNEYGETVTVLLNSCAGSP